MTGIYLSIIKVMYEKLIANIMPDGEKSHSVCSKVSHKMGDTVSMSI